MKSVKHEHLFYLHLYMSSEHTLSFQLHKTDLGLISRTFSLKINKLTTFSEITQVWQCLNIVFIRSDEFTY